MIIELDNPIASNGRIKDDSDDAYVPEKILPKHKQKEIKETVSRYYILLRLIVLLPLSMINRIGNVYFWVHFVLSSTQTFDTWWKVLSFIGYIFYFTVGSILFFLIAPDLQTQVGQTDRSFGYFGGIFGELKGLVFRNRYSQPQTYLKQSQSRKKKQTKQGQQSFTALYDNRNRPTNAPEFKYTIEIKQKSSIIKHSKRVKQNRQLEKLKSEYKQKQQQLSKLNKKIGQYRLLSAQSHQDPEQGSQQSNISNGSRMFRSQVAQNPKEINSQDRLRRQQLKKDLQKLNKTYNNLNRILKQKQIIIDKKEKEWKKREQSENLKIQAIKQQIQSYQVYFSRPSSRVRSVKSQKLFQKFLSPSNPQHKEEQQDTIIKFYMNREKDFLINEIKLLQKQQKVDEFFYDIILNQTLQYSILDHELKYLSDDEKQHLISRMNLKTNLKQLNTIQVKEKKFYLFLFNLLNATDAMIAWYAWFKLSDVSKFQRFELFYYFLILSFEQIPQIIAQGCSLSYVYENKINIAIFGVSLLKIIVCTLYQLYKLYSACNTKNPQTQTQKQNRLHKQRIKIFRNYHESLTPLNRPPSIQNQGTSKYFQVLSECLVSTFVFIAYIFSNILPIVNRVLLYIFLKKVLDDDILMFWVSVICLAYYFVVGNSLAIAFYQISDSDRKKYQQSFFFCVPEDKIKLFISMIIILLNILNGCLIPLLFLNVQNCVSRRQRTLTKKFIKFYEMYVFVYLAFEAIPFTIIYSLAIPRCIENQDRVYDIVLLSFITVSMVCSLLWFWMIKSKDVPDSVQEVFKIERGRFNENNR